MGNGAKIALVGVLALIVLVVAVWDRKNEEKHDEGLRNLPLVPLAERAPSKVRVVTSEPAAQDRMSGTITQGPLATSGTLNPGGKHSLFRPKAPLVPVARPSEPHVGLAGARPAPPPAAPPGRRHVIRSTDSLYAIAKKEYGSGEAWRRILEANRDVIQDPGRLPVGKEIAIPPAEAADTRATPAATTVRPALSHSTEVTTLPLGARLYTVERGDTLDKIAQKLLGSATKWRLILEANKEKLPRVESLRAGQQLVIPAGR